MKEITFYYWWYSNIEKNKNWKWLRPLVIGFMITLGLIVTITDSTFAFSLFSLLMIGFATLGYSYIYSKKRIQDDIKKEIYWIESRKAEEQ